MGNRMKKREPQKETPEDPASSTNQCNDRCFFLQKSQTHTDHYLDFNSHHHTQQKHSVVRTLIDWVKNIPSSEEET